MALLDARLVPAFAALLVTRRMLDRAEVIVYHVVCSENGPAYWLQRDGTQVYAYDVIGARHLVEGVADLEAAARKLLPQHRLAETHYQPGDYHPRIQREHTPQAANMRRTTPPMAELFPRECRAAIVAAQGLFERLEAVFRVVEPALPNLRTFGHELRHLLILASTEVESSLKAVLTTNQIDPLRGGRYSLTDYERLRQPMRLGDWAVVLPNYPDMPRLTPFIGWTASAAPAWWSNYNAVKHNREGDLHRATIESVLNAMAAVYVVIAAQFGAAILHLRGAIPLPPGEFLAADDGFPNWEPQEFYVPPQLAAREDWTPRNLVL